MAESDVQGSSLSAGSETVFDIVCQPCSSDGNIAEAEAYCQDCCEHLCGQCIKHHKKFSSMKHHQLVDKDAMPATQDDPKVLDVCTERCTDHQGEILKFFCPDHDALACNDCVTLHHKTCDLDYIKDVAEDSARDFMSDLEDEDLTQESDMVKLALEGKQKSSDCHANAIQDLDAYRKKLVDAVDRGIQQMKDHAGYIFSQDTEKMDKLATLGNQAIAELRSMMDEFRSLQEKKMFCKMFVEMKRKEKRLNELHDNIEGLGGDDPEVTTYSFQPDDELRTTVSRHGGLGKLLVTSFGKINAKHMTDINVKSTDNDSICKITGIAMVSQDKVVVADYNNETIKLIDTVKNKIISELSPEEFPMDVVVCNDTIAATLPEASKILFLKHDEGLVHDRDISVDGSCMGIDWFDDKLYVAFDDEKRLDVMTTTGVVLQKFYTTDKGENTFKYPQNVLFDDEENLEIMAITEDTDNETEEHLFDDPQYVTVSAANKRIYVTDFGKDQVIVLDMDGKQTGVYDDVDLEEPRQLAVTRTGMLFLCDYEEDTIHLLSPYGEKLKILLTSEDGIESPWSVCYCENTRRLYVGMESDTIKVYQIS